MAAGRKSQAQILRETVAALKEAKRQEREILERAKTERMLRRGNDYAPPKRRTRLPGPMTKGSRAAFGNTWGIPGGSQHRGVATTHQIYHDATGCREATPDELARIGMLKLVGGRSNGMWVVVPTPRIR